MVTSLYKKSIAILLSLSIIFCTCVLSHKEANANPILFLVEALGSALGISSLATGGLLASMDANQGISIQPMDDALYNYVNNNKILMCLCAIYKRQIYAEELKGEFLKEAIGKLKDYLVDTYLVDTTTDTESITYTIPQQIQDYMNYANSLNKCNEKITIQNVSTSNVDTQSDNEYIIPTEAIDIYTFENTYYTGNTYTTSKQDVTSNVLSLSDGIYSFVSKNDYQFYLSVDDAITNQTYTYVNDYLRSKIFFKLSTENSIRYITLNKVKIELNNGVIIKSKGNYMTSNMTFDHIYALKYAVSNLNSSTINSLGVQGDVVSLPKSATAKSVYTSVPIKNTDAKTISYATSAVIPTTPNIPSTDEVSFWGTVTAWLSSFWNKMTTFGTTITGTIGSVITGEADKTRNKMAEEYEKSRTQSKEQTGTIAGGIDGVKDSVNSVKESVDSLTDSVEGATSVDASQKINWEPLKKSGTLFTTKFPFSLPWDLYKTIKALLVDNPSDPIWDIKWHDEILNKDFGFTLDLSKFGTMFKVARVFILISMVVALIISTRKLLGGAT